MTTREVWILAAGVNLGVLWTTAAYFLPGLIADRRARRAARREGRP